VLQHDDYAVTLPEFYVDLFPLTNLTFVLDRGFVVQGRVIDSNGRPIPEAEVREVNDRSYRRRTVRTDQDGAFMLKGVGEYQTYSSRAPEKTDAGSYVIRGP